MKLVIATQYMENYGAHDWDGKGACPQYWKAKGGSTYVVENLTPAQCREAIDSGCPTLRGLIEYSNDGSREYVIDVNVADNTDKVGDEWETVTKLSYEGGKWVAREVTENDEYGYLNKKIARKSTRWTMLKEGQRSDYEVSYTLRTGEEVYSENIGEALAA